MTPLFYLFAALALVGGIGVVAFRNPVSSAFAMIVSFLGLAALFIQLNAFLAGILQILVYAGAIMVLFLFIIMLLDVPEEERRRLPLVGLLAGGVVAAGFVALLGLLAYRFGDGKSTLPALERKPEGHSDIHAIGDLLFGTYWLPVLMVGLLLLIATVGVIVLSKKELR